MVFCLHPIHGNDLFRLKFIDVSLLCSWPNCGSFTSGLEHETSILCSVIATVMALPSSSTAGRLLLLLKAISETETSSSKRAKKKSSYDVGSLVQAEVDSLKNIVTCLILFLSYIIIYSLSLSLVLILSK